MLKEILELIKRRTQEKKLLKALVNKPFDYHMLAALLESIKNDTEIEILTAIGDKIVLRKTAKQRYNELDYYKC